jgi:hypothetical protein
MLAAPERCCACTPLQPNQAPLFDTFDEALAATQPIQRAPPVAPGQSGNDFYTVQPQQLLSWYPRRVHFHT